MPITLNGSTGITYPAGGLGNTAGAAVGTTDTQTLTNKTLTSPTITSSTIISTDSANTRQLGYAQVTANQASITTIVDLTGLSVTVNVLSGQRVKVTGFLPLMSSTVSTDQIGIVIDKGGVQVSSAFSTAGNSGVAMTVFLVESPTAGSITYKLRAIRNVGTGSITMNASTAYPAFILVEAL